MSQQCSDQAVWTFDLTSERGQRRFFFESHPYPHFDDAIAMFAIQKEATDEFFERYGTHIPLGVGGGPFDEHPEGDLLRKGRHSAATLVAEALGIDRSPVWRRLINFAHFADTGVYRSDRHPRMEESGHPFDANNMLKARWRRLREAKKQDGTMVSQEHGLRITCELFEWLDDFLWDEQKMEEARQEIAKKGKRLDITGPGGATLKLVLIHSDNPKINVAARCYFSADLVVQRESTDHVHIFVQQGKTSVCLDDLAQMVRLKEQYLSREVICNRWGVLRLEGTLPGERWYYFRPSSNRSIQQLHNGTEQYPDTPPTLIGDDRLLEYISVAMDTDYYHPDFADGCRKGECAGSRCPLYQWGLQRCRRVRGLKYQQQIETS